MDSRVKITKDGGVYMYVPSECVEILKGYQYDLVCFPQEKPEPVGDNDDEDVFIYVGTITDFHIERIGMLPTLESVKAYIEEYGRVPWGIKTLEKKYKWKRLSEKGYSLTLIDVNGQKLKFNRRTGKVDLG